MNEILNNSDRKALILDKVPDSAFASEFSEVKAEKKMRVAYPVYATESSYSQTVEKFPQNNNFFEESASANTPAEPDTLDRYFDYTVTSNSEDNNNTGGHIPYVRSDMPEHFSFEVKRSDFLHTKPVSVSKKLLFSDNSNVSNVAYVHPNVPDVPVVSSTDTPTARFCKYCGKPVDIDSVFCACCGKPIHNNNPNAHQNVFLSITKNTFISRRVVPDNSPKSLKYRTRLINSLQKAIHTNDVECFHKVWVSPKSRSLAIVLAALGLVGFGGLNRLYTGKYVSGALAFLFTPYGFLLSIYDLYCLLLNSSTDAQGRFIINSGSGSVLTESERAALINERQVKREQELNVLNQLMLEDDGYYTNLS